MIAGIDTSAAPYNVHPARVSSMHASCSERFKLHCKVAQMAPVADLSTIDSIADAYRLPHYVLVQLPGDGCRSELRCF
jgi:hypothetical protein